MLATLFAPFAQALVSGLIAALAGAIKVWLDAKNNQAIGANSEAATVTTQTLKVQTAIAQSEAQPVTLDDVLARLQAGTA